VEPKSCCSLLCSNDLGGGVPQIEAAGVKRDPKMARRRGPSLGARDTRSAPDGLPEAVKVRTPSVSSPIAVDWNTEPLQLSPSTGVLGSVSD